MNNHHRLSVIVPLYNIPKALNNIKTIESTLEKSFPKFEIICVEDGQNGHSKNPLAKYKSKKIKILSYPFNIGKGFALAYGFSQSKGNLVAFLDGDMEIHPKQLRLFVDLMDLVDADIVIGSKRHPLSQIDYPLIRKFYSRIYQTIIRILFGLNVTDTQVGIKLFKRKVLEDVLPKLVVKRFAFDLEVLVVAHRLGYKRIVEAPVQLRMRPFGSNIGFGAVRNMLQDTAAIFYRRYILRHYEDHPRSPVRRIKKQKVKK
ncbi:MAG: glycosyltransferase [bacterium]|nr:glycosyltransferase [bacterium]